VGSCTVNWRIVGGDKPFLVKNGDSMKLYTPQLAYVGTHSVQLEVYYSAWTEPVEPTRTQTIDLTVTIEEQCDYISYLPDSAFVVPADIRQIIFDVETRIQFNFEHLETCNLIQTYGITVDGVVVDPAWLDIDTSVSPPELVIFSNQIAHAGSYSVIISAKANTVPVKEPT